jgi:hypothetical protein
LQPRAETWSGPLRSSRLTRVPPPIRISDLGVHCRLKNIKILKLIQLNAKREISRLECVVLCIALQEHGKPFGIITASHPKSLFG